MVRPSQTDPAEEQVSSFVRIISAVSPAASALVRFDPDVFADALVFHPALKSPDRTFSLSNVFQSLI